MRALSYILAALAIAAAVPAEAASPSVESAKVRVDAAVEAWTSAMRRQAETKSRYEALELRIHQLKKGSASGAFSRSSELDKLLKESVGADEALRGEERSVETSANQLKARVREAIQKIDEEITLAVPSLKQGSLKDQQNAARAINELRELRRTMKQIVAGMDQAAASVPREWSRYEVKVDPLDGPKELQEKADFVEDQLDKFKKKREELAHLIQEAREEQGIQKSGWEFRTDVRHFDEEARLGRVSRQAEKSSGGASSLFSPTLGGGASSPNTRSSAPAPSNTPSNAGGTMGANPGAPGATQNPPPQSPPPTTTNNSGTPKDTNNNPQPPRGAGGNADDGTSPNPSTGASSPPQTGVTAAAGDKSNPNANTVLGAQQGKAYEASPIAKPLDPNTLLNLRVDTLDASAVDLKTLQSYASDLDKLERFLESRAVELRRRAAEMKASGKK